MNFIAILFGWLMRLIYQVVHSYGISIILFTLVVKLITLPSTYQMQLNQARMSMVASKLNKIKKAFPNNPQRVQEETNKLYSQEGINPSSGCLGSFLTIFLVFGVYQVVLRPLTYVLRMDSDMLENAKALLLQWIANNEITGITERTINSRPELFLLRYANSNPDIFSSMPEFLSKLQNFDNTFLGFDLTGTPSLHPANGWSFTAVMLVLLPVLSAISQLAITIVSQAHNKKANPDTASQMAGMNAMLYLSPLMTIWIGMSVPAGLSFYWLAQSVLSLIIQLLLYQYLKGERLNKLNEKEKEKQLKKGPGWMQRMMEQSAQMAAEQNGTGSRADANHTRYTDGDDGMSRKERQEYERKLIEAARKRAALKYGDDLPSDSSNEN